MSAAPPGRWAGVDLGTQFTRIVLLDAAAEGVPGDGPPRPGDIGSAPVRPGTWLVTGPADARRDPAAAGGELLAGLTGDAGFMIMGEAGARELTSVSGLAVAVAGDGFRDEAGTRVRARLRQSLADRLGLPPGAVAVHSTAVCAAAVRAAQLAATGDLAPAGRLVLVCDIGADAVETALIEIGPDPGVAAPAGVATVRLLERRIQAGYAGRRLAADAVRRAGPAGPASLDDPDDPDDPDYLADFAGLGGLGDVDNPERAGGGPDGEAATPPGDGTRLIGGPPPEDRTTRVSGPLPQLPRGDPGQPNLRPQGDMWSGDDLARAAGPALAEAETELVLTFLDGVRASRERVVTVLANAAGDPRWLAAGALVFGSGRRLTAGELMAAFQPVAQTLRAAVGGLLRHRDDLRRPSSPPDAVSPDAVPWPEVMIVGGLGFLPLVKAAVRQAVAETWPAGRPSGAAEVAVRPVAEPEYAAARGAALLAAGKVRAVELYPHMVSVRVHRVLAGRLSAGNLRVISAGGVPRERCEHAGRPVTVHHDGSAGGMLAVDVRAGDGADPEVVRLPLPAGLKPGKYHVGIRVDRSRLGALLLSPADGGPATALPLG
ncbi:hypothetical protein UG55_1001122 [Frankia sp. EI5c]|uniref:hypothetical protein n=1 Tax=Frankia sp. EI5c TaxID=683316 RepID=UPI0007C346A3|nr:hypothetical protein [Frankia sp. EI5c]OAA29617.1 hypothetical protein UG55_1001122 [Frankia sp. EI5c]